MANQGVPSFGEVLCYLHEKNCPDWSQATLATVAGLNHSSVSRLESGGRGASANMVEKLSWAMELEEDDRKLLYFAAGHVPPELRIQYLRERMPR